MIFTPRSASSRVRRHAEPRLDCAGESRVRDVDGDDFGAHHQIPARIAIEGGAMLVEEPLGAQRTSAQ